jgi:hypothetical protein
MEKNKKLECPSEARPGMHLYLSVASQPEAGEHLYPSAAKQAK